MPRLVTALSLAAFIGVLAVWGWAYCVGSSNCGKTAAADDLERCIEYRNPAD
jgi:hypothetical protein